MVAAGLAVFASTFCARPLPPTPAFEGAMPETHVPAGVTIHAVLTGVTHRSAGVAYRGGSFRDKRDFSMAGALVRHPKGDVLVDTGLGKDIDRQILLMPFWFRWTTSFTRTRSAAEQLGEGRKPSAVLLTHAHWDHASGLPEFPGVPVWITAEEHKFIDEGGWIADIAKSTNAKWQEFGFESGPWLGFPKSHDVYGDGAIVVVPAPGHTPGSVIVFVTTSDGKRWAMIGDLAWQREGIVDREERPWLIRSLADQDAGGVRENILRMNALHQRFPELVIVPAHDARAFAEMPAL